VFTKTASRIIYKERKDNSIYFITRVESDAFRTSSRFTLICFS
jgi:hypothetical protein